ncbi:MAG: GNAT family N-acetyltransferase [Planctomycetota bacterium]
MPRVYWSSDSRLLQDMLSAGSELSRGVPLQGASWLSAWWKHFSDQGDLRILAVETKGRIKGLLPFYQRRSEKGLGVLRNLADGDVCTDYVSVLSGEEDRTWVSKAMARFLSESADDGASGWSSLVLDGVVDGDEPMDSFLAALSEQGAAVHRHSRMHTWFKPCHGDWDDYLKNCSRGSRSKQRRMLKTLENTEGLEVVEATDAEQIHWLLSDLIELHQARWNSIGEAGSFADPKLRHFIHEAAANANRDGELWLVGIRQQGRLVSAALSFVGRNRRAYCYSTATDLSEKKLQPGKLLTLHLIREAHRRGLDGVDFLRGDEEYKSRLQAVPRKVMEIRVAAPNMVSQLRHAAWLAQFEAKQFLRKRLGRKTADVVGFEEPVRAPSSRPE